MQGNTVSKYDSKSILNTPHVPCTIIPLTSCILEIITDKIQCCPVIFIIRHFFKFFSNLSFTITCKDSSGHKANVHLNIMSSSMSGFVLRMVELIEGIPSLGYQQNAFGSVNYSNNIMVCLSFISPALRDSAPDPILEFSPKYSHRV